MERVVLGPPSEDEQLDELRESERLATEGSVDIALGPNRRMRINLAKNTKGFNHESTIEIDGVISTEALYEAMDQLDMTACRLIVRGIARRDAIDRGEFDAAAALAAQVAIPGPADTIDELPF